MTTDRWYVRCVECLSIGAVEVKPTVLRRTWADKFDPIAEWTCGICGGNLELMGKVTPDNTQIEREEDRTPCDKRCTHAIGPLCVCKCGCANHGTGRVVTITIREAKPVIVFEDAETKLKEVAIYHEERERARAVVASIPKGYFNYETYKRYQHIRQSFGKAIASRTMKARMKHLNEVRL